MVGSLEVDTSYLVSEVARPSAALGGGLVSYLIWYNRRSSHSALMSLLNR